jgi:membrane-bound metal-dependent hydrolase YbcI (DUF457 family)
MVHAVAPTQVSFLAFCAANILIDVEPLYFMLTRQFPLHRMFHTVIGASIIVIATIALFSGARKLATVVPLPNVFGWQQLSIGPIVVGAALGSYSHIVLDSLMHSDIRPLAPFSDVNPLLHSVSLGALHWSCVVAGVIGLVILGVRAKLGGTHGL